MDKNDLIYISRSVVLVEEPYTGDVTTLFLPLISKTLEERTYQGQILKDYSLCVF